MSEQLRTTVKSFCEKSPPVINIYLVMRNKNDSEKVELRFVNIENESNDDLAKMFSEFLKSRIVDEDDLKICSLDDEESVGAVYRYDYQEFPQELDYFWNLPPKREVSRYDSDRDELRNLFGFIIILKNDNDKTLVMFKKHYAFSVIRSDKTVVAIGRKKVNIPGIIGSIPVAKHLAPYDELYKLLNETDLIQLDGTVHMIRVNGTVYILDPRVLNQMTGVMEAIDKKADETIRIINNLGLLASIELLEQFRNNNNRYARKLARIGKNSPVLDMLSKEELKVQAVVDFTKSPYFEGLFSYKTEGGKEKIVFGNKDGKNSKKAVDAFLHLLSDSYLVSELTKRRYASVAKERLSVRAIPKDNDKKHSTEHAVEQK